MSDLFGSNDMFVESARSKRVSDDQAHDAPSQQSMRGDRRILANPSTDQKRVRREMARKTAIDVNNRVGDYDLVTEPGWYIVDTSRNAVMDGPFDSREEARPWAYTLAENGLAGSLTIRQKTSARSAAKTPHKEIPSMTTQRETDILRAMARTTTQHSERLALAEELANLRLNKSAARQQQRDLEYSDMVVRVTTTPVGVYSRTTTETDWLSTTASAGTPDEAHREMLAQASLFFQAKGPDVKSDPEEYTQQATGMARFLAGKYGEAAPGAEATFVAHAEFLRRRFAATQKMGEEVRPEDGEDGEYSTTPDDVAQMPASTKDKSARRRIASEVTEAEQNAGAEYDPYDDENEWNHDGSRRTAGCSTCGDPVERDPEGEQNRSYHHTDSGTHDHEAKPGKDTKESSRRTAGEYAGGSPKEGDSAKCHKDGGAIQFFDGQWMHLKGTGGSHNDVYPPNKSERNEKNSRRKTAAARPLHEIARDIRRSWPKVNYAAVPYLDALDTLDSITDSYYEDSAKSIVAYLLSNMTTFRGPDAQRIKTELRALSSRSAHRVTADEVRPEDGENSEYSTTPQDAAWAPGSGGDGASTDAGTEVPDTNQGGQEGTTQARRRRQASSWEHGLSGPHEGQVYSCVLSMDCPVVGTASEMDAHYATSHLDSINRDLLRQGRRRTALEDGQGSTPAIKNPEQVGKQQNGNGESNVPTDAINDRETFDDGDRQGELGKVPSGAAAGVANAPRPGSPEYASWAKSLTSNSALNQLIAIEEGKGSAPFLGNPGEIGNAQNGQSESGIPYQTPMEMDDDDVFDDAKTPLPKVPSGAADVKNAPKPYTSSQRIAAFQAAVRANINHLERGAR